ncbi:Bifunctional solanapyrone synthase 4 [Paraphaeosphaeria sporulosa]
MAPVLLQVVLSLATSPFAKFRPDGVSPACKSLNASFPDLTYFPGSETYARENTFFWSRACVRSPPCIFEPESPQHVADALKTIRETNSMFAVRSGGHMTVPGAASTSEGVLIATTRLDSRQLSQNDTIARLGPSVTWGEAYDWLAPRRLAVVGGRFAPVGIAGLLLGGGMSYFSNQLGWAASSVVNMQVVLANGTVVDANATSNPDLFWALKGGSCNFGIVTRFDIKTHDVGEVFAGGVTYEGEQMEDYVHAIANFVAPGGGAEDPLAGILPTVQIGPIPGVVSGPAFLFHRGLDPFPQALRNFTKIPTVHNAAHIRPTFSSFSDETVPYGDRSMRTLFWMTSLKMTLESVYLMNDTFVSAAVSQLNIPGLFVAMSFQPITLSHMEAAREAGGDAIDLDPADGPILAALIVTGWQNTEDDEVVEKFSINTLGRLDELAGAANLSYPFTFLNDAGRSQKVFGQYGGGKSLPRMRDIARAYDPEGVFQKLNKGGFKLW